MAEAQTSLPEYKIKANYLYNFGKHVEWPADAFPQTDSPFVIGVLGEDPFRGMLEEIVRNRSLVERRIVVRHFRRADEARGCHILFIAPSEKARLPQILGRLNRASTLTVSDAEQFLARGGMIQFTLENKKIRLAINPDAAERAGLKIGSQLLGLSGVRIERH